MASSLYENAQKRNELENKIKIFDKKLIDLENEKMNNRKNIENLKNNIKNLEDESNNIEEIPQDKILSIQNEILKNENLLKDLAKKENEYKKMISEKEELNILITKKENNLKGLEILKRNYTDDRKKFLVYELEKNLSDGDTCPLCGGIYHKNHFSISDNISFNEEEFEALEKNITNLKNDLMLSNEKIKNIISITDDIKNEINIIPQIKNEINNLKNEIENFLEENKEKKVRLSFLEKKIKEQNSSLNNFEIKSAKIEIEINNINSSLKEANDNLSKIEKSEFSLTELKENFETLKENSKKYFELDNELNSTRESKKYIYDKKIVPWTDKIKEFENDINTKTGERKSLILEFSNLASEINSVLPENKVCSHEYIEEIKNSINKIDEIKKEIEDYKNRSIYTLNTILEYKNQLGNRSFSKEKFENLSESDKMINRDLEQNIEESGKISNTIEHFNENRKKVENLLEEKEKIEIKLNPAKELFELLKGRKFLDFLSAGKLQSITRVASDTLQKITNGRYRINVDEKSDFSIIDNFNSAIRKPESLSGGETFMVSLCLALALANQIQLRGKSRLEFFFLDEGFGTLDSELLEIVFTVLENLRSEGMTVGIITHVEEIKNRVVRKLLVTPAQVGVSGTIVKEI